MVVEKVEGGKFGVKGIKLKNEGRDGDKMDKGEMDICKDK